MDAWQVLWLMLASVIVGGLMVIFSAFVTGYLVFRAKRETHETLFPPEKRKSKGPIVIDELSEEAKQDDDSELPPIIQQMNNRIGSELASLALKKGVAE